MRSIRNGIALTLTGDNLLDEQRGEPDNAFAALQRGVEVNDPGLNTLRVDPLFDPIRKDSRFAVLLKQLDVGA